MKETWKLVLKTDAGRKFLKIKVFWKVSDKTEYAFLRDINDNPTSTVLNQTVLSEFYLQKRLKKQLETD